jgi:hypothetical protein
VVVGCADAIGVPVLAGDADGPGALELVSDTSSTYWIVYLPDVPAPCDPR